MRVTVVGAGAIGGYLAVRLSRAGADVTCIARGPNLAAIQQKGMSLILEDGTVEAAPKIRGLQNMAEAGEQDVVLVTLKAHQVQDVAPQMRALYGPNTMVVTMQNGIPWWYFHKLGGDYDGRPVTSVDPQGIVAANLEVDRVIGAVVYPATELVEPGVVQLIEGNRFTLGELDGSRSERIEALSALMIAAGFKSPVARDIRAEMWVKLWGNLSFNPISALTHATLEDICRQPLTRELAATMMTEAQTIAEKLGIEFKISLDKRIAGAEAVGAHKTSMLQDVDGGRPLELEALVGSVRELGRITGTPTPAIDAVYALVSLLAQTLATQGGKLAVQSR